METQDRRIKRTQNLLAKALIELTLEKSYEAVTIRDITERADVGYATFFRHYGNKAALLKDVLEVVLAELLGLLEPSQVPASEHAEIGKLIFQYAEQHKEVVQVLLSNHSLSQHLIELGTRNALANLDVCTDLIPAEIVAHHIVVSTIGLVEWWLAHNRPYSVERMGLIYQQLIMQSANKLIYQS